MLIQRSSRNSGEASSSSREDASSCCENTEAESNSIQCGNGRERLDIGHPAIFWHVQCIYQVRLPCESGRIFTPVASFRSREATGVCFRSVKLDKTRSTASAVLQFFVDQSDPGSRERGFKATETLKSLVTVSRAAAFGGASYQNKVNTTEANLKRGLG